MAKKKVKSKKKSSDNKKMTKKKKTFIAVVAVVVVVGLLFLSLLLFTNVFGYEGTSAAEMKKIEQKLSEIEVPEIPYADFIKDGSSGPPSPPPVPNVGDYNIPIK